MGDLYGKGRIKLQGFETCRVVLDFCNVVISVEKLRIRTNAPVYFQVDGEYIGEVSSLDAHIEKGAVDMVTGASGN